MASHAPSIAAAALTVQSHSQSAAATERALFTLAKPIKGVLDGAEIDLAGFDMRALDTADLPLLDQHRGDAVALSQNVIAALCDLTIDQVRQLDLADFTMLAGEVLWQIGQVETAMGLPDGHFLAPHPDRDTA